jgi:glycosyltransferase involved in cell wall biosynthesis
MRVSIGIVNCNRLHYLRSQLASLIETLAGDVAFVRELIIVDNASVEPGTDAYLRDLPTIGSGCIQHVIRHEQRDPNNEFARALNEIVSIAEGDVIIPLQGDSQFIRRGWLRDALMVVERPDCGCVVLDAQRRATHQAARLVRASREAFIDLHRPPIAGAGDVAYRREIIKQVYPWSTENAAHEVVGDSETKMLQRVRAMQLSRSLVSYVLASPAAVQIVTDPRGTNARVRGNRRYGAYWPARDGDMYYRIVDALPCSPNASYPVTIEDAVKLACPIGWEAPLAPDGSWLKNPIRPEDAQPGEWTELE